MDNAQRTAYQGRLGPGANGEFPFPAASKGIATMKSSRTARRAAASIALVVSAGLVAPAPASGQLARAPQKADAPAATAIKLSPAVLQRAQTHSFRPANLAGVRREPKVDPAPLIALTGRKLKLAPRVDVKKWTEAVHAALKDKVRGYAMAIRKGGQPHATLIWGEAQTPSAGWSLATRMHVASVSKLMTAIVAVKMLDERNLSFDTKIGPYLPEYWTPGTRSRDITFRELLTHRAGFTDANYDGDFLTFKRQIEQGVAANPASNYTNGSFSLVRVLGATLTGALPRSFKAPQGVANDAVWDVAATDAFLEYAQQKVFTPSGVANVSPTPIPSPSNVRAVAYATKGDTKGWDSGPLATQLGGAGFRLSVDDVLDVMGTFRRKGTIVSKAKAQEALDASLGIDNITDSALGKIYDKNGWWGGDCTNDVCHVEQSVAFFLPGDMEAVVLVNSNIGVDSSLRGTIRNAYLNAIVD